MSSFGLRVRFLLPEDQAIQEENEAVELPLSAIGKTALLKAVPSGSIKDSRNLSIRCGGFPSQEAAYSAGQRIKNTLLLCGSRLKLGIDVGQDRALSGPGKVVKERAKAVGLLLLSDVHGLLVFSEDLPVRFASVTAKAVLGKPLARFIEEFVKAYELAPIITDRQSLALELYAASNFESSLRARFIGLINVVEALSEQSKQPENVVAYLGQLINEAKTARHGLDRSEQAAMYDVIERLGYLKTESISRACRELVRARLGEREAKEFKGYYKTRSDILHRGLVSSEVDLGRDVPQLDDLVARLVYADVANSSRA